jgi:hypothetical protein
VTKNDQCIGKNKGSRCGSAVKWWKWENKRNRVDPGLLPTPGNLFKKNIRTLTTTLTSGRRPRQDPERRSVDPERSVTVHQSETRYIHICNLICPCHGAAWRNGHRSRLRNRRPGSNPTIRDRCYDHNFLPLLTIFGEKNWRFSQKPMIKCFHNSALFWVKNANFFAEVFGENITLESTDFWIQSYDHELQRSVVKIYNSTKSLARFKNKNIFYPMQKCSSLLYLYNAGVLVLYL